MDLRALYGTDDPAPPPRRLSAGALTVTLAPGGVGAVHWGGVEVLRAAQALVRDTDWGTWPEDGAQDEVAEAADGFRVTHRFRIADGAVAGRVEIVARVGPDRAEVTLALSLDADRVLTTNRAGFVVLHPAALAGTPLRLRRPDGGEGDGAFPQAIAPAQPFRDIAGLQWESGGLRLTIGFRGEIFEMEDQRNWSDGSYKTYCRPLALPWPYDITPGAPVRQDLRLTICGAPAGAGATADRAAVQVGDRVGTMPAMHLAEEPGWGRTGLLPRVQGRRLRIDLTQALPHHPARAGAGDLDLELVLPDDATAAEGVLGRLAATGLSPQRVAAVPAAFMASHQPDGIWPGGLRPEGALDLAVRAFPMARPMGGMLTYFTELNRYPAAAQTGDSVTFGTAAIVHDAADLAVMQTLEALPAVFGSAAALAGGRPLRLGLVAIAMRTNPYGAGLAGNPQGRRRTMTDNDPRHRAAFGAAFALGAVAATLGAQVQSLCLGATGGPFGVDAGAGLSPLGTLIAALAQEAGRPRHAVAAPPGVAAVASDRRLFLANLGAGSVAFDAPPIRPLGPYEVRIIDRSLP